MPGSIGDTILFQSSPTRYRAGVLAGNITETSADVVVFSDGYGWEHGESCCLPSLFLPGVPYGDAPWQWQLSTPAFVTTHPGAYEARFQAPAFAGYAGHENPINPIAVYYSRD